MDALDLILLGRRLTKVGELVLRGSAEPTFPTGPSLVLRDAFAHPDASINDIAERTALQQSYVSESVAKLVDQGLIHTTVDPDDKRRTLVRVSEDHSRTAAQRGALPVDAAVVEALGGADAGVANEVLTALTMLSERFRPATLGPVLRQVRSVQEPGG